MTNKKTGLLSAFLRAYARKSFYVALILFLLAILLFLHPRKQGADENHYLAWGHSFFYDQDFFLHNQFEALELPFHLTPTGYIGELRNLGVALFWQPFYTLATFASFSTEGNPKLVADGNTHLLFLNWSAFVFVALAGLFVTAALRRYFSGSVIWLTLFVLFFGTPLGYYTLQRPLSSHPLSILLAAVLLFLLSKPGISGWRCFGIGFVTGWLMLVATYNVALLLAPLAIISANFVLYRNWQRFFIYGTTLTVGAILGFLPQMLGWRALYGGFLTSPYAGQLQWFNPRIFETLFSTFHGLFIYAPVLLLAPIGLFIFARRNKVLTLGIGLSWGALLYIAAINLAWWAGASFGNRYFLGLTPFFAVMLAALIQHSRYWLLPIVPGVAWIVGLWLQTLDGTLKIGDATFYSLPTLALNQLSAWQNLPLLIEPFNNHWLNTFSLGTVLIVIVTSVTIFSVAAYAVQLWSNSHSRIPVLGLVTGAILLILFTLFTWQQSENTKTQLVAAGFYQQPHRVSAYDPVDLSKTYLDRADYYHFTGQTDKILPDLQAAARSWFSNSRQILGHSDQIEPERQMTQPLHLNFGPEMRLTGYHWRSSDATLTLYWTKTAEVSENSYVPIIRLLDPDGQTVWQGQPDDPFPARFIPADYIFSDVISIDPALLLTPVWLQIDLGPAHSPTNIDQQPHPGIIPLQNDVTAATDTAAKQPELLPGSISSGDDVLVQPVWQSDTAARYQPHAEVRLTHMAGQQILTQPVTLRLQNGWDASRRQTATLRDTFCIKTPPSLQSGHYQLEVLTKDAQQHAPILAAGFEVDNSAGTSSQQAGLCTLLHLGPDREYWPAAQPVTGQANFAEQVVLLDHTLNPVSEAGQTQLTINLRWLSLINNPMLGQPVLRLVDDDGHLVAETTWTPVWGTHPAKYWFQNEIIADSVDLAIPDLPSGNYNLRLTWKMPNGVSPLSYMLRKFVR